MIQFQSVKPNKKDTVIMCTNWINCETDLFEVVNMPLEVVSRIKDDIGVWKIKQLKQ